MAIYTRVDVERIFEAGGRASPLALSDGTEVAARCVVANANPRLVAKLAGAPVWPEALASYQCESATFRINVALS